MSQGQRQQKLAKLHGGSVGDKIEMLRQAAVSLSVGSKLPGEDTVGAKQGSRLHDVCTLTVPHCSSNMDSVCSGERTMNHHQVFSPLVLNLRLTRRPDGRLGQSREMAFLIAVTVQLFIVPQILLAPVTLVWLLWLLNREECGAEPVVSLLATEECWFWGTPALCSLHPGMLLRVFQI